MGLFDKFLDVMKMGDDDDDDDYDDDFYDEDDDEPVKPVIRPKKIDETIDESPRREKAVKSSSKITPLRSSRKSSNTNMEVCVIKPSTFEDAREIAETLLSNQTVILNMEGLDLGLSQRIIDFSSGACYSIDGTLQKISNFIFLLTPSSVDISGDLQNVMEAYDFSGIQTGF